MIDTMVSPDASSDNGEEFRDFREGHGKCQEDTEVSKQRVKGPEEEERSGTSEGPSGEQPDDG